MRPTFRCKRAIKQRFWWYRDDFAIRNRHQHLAEIYLYHGCGHQPLDLLVKRRLSIVKRISRQGPKVTPRTNSDMRQFIHLNCEDPFVGKSAARNSATKSLEFCGEQRNSRVISHLTYDPRVLCEPPQAGKRENSRPGPLLGGERVSRRAMFRASCANPP